MNSDTKYVFSMFTLNFRPRLLRGSYILLNNNMPPKGLKVYDSRCKAWRFKMKPLIERRIACGGLFLKRSTDAQK